MSILIHGHDKGLYGVSITYGGLNDTLSILMPGGVDPILAVSVGPNDFVPRVDAAIAALEYAWNNHCGLVEAQQAIVISDEPATQNGSDLTVVRPGVVSISMAAGDDAHHLRAVIVEAVLNGTVGKNWVVTVATDGLSMTIADPAVLPPPWNLAYAQMQVDYLQRLS